MAYSCPCQRSSFRRHPLPTVFVNTPYFGNSAVEIENLITRPLEKQIENITGVKNVNSTSIQDFSVIIAEFEADLEMDAVVRKVKDAVDKAKQDLANRPEGRPNGFGNQSLRHSHHDDQYFRQLLQ
jgi:multidrug efflux pump